MQWGRAAQQPVQVKNTDRYYRVRLGRRYRLCLARHASLEWGTRPSRAWFRGGRVPYLGRPHHTFRSSPLDL